jgi:hypothetical protein
MGITNREISIQYQQKFDFFLIALGLAVVALSVETAAFGESGFADGMELLGWIAILASSFFGLLRVEIVPALYRSRAQINEQELELDRLHDLRRSGELWLQRREDETKVSIESEIEFFEALINRNSSTLQADEARLIPRYRLQKWLLVSGIASIAVARSVPAVKEIWQSIFA